MSPFRAGLVTGTVVAAVASCLVVAAGVVIGALIVAGGMADDILTPQEAADVLTIVHAADLSRSRWYRPTEHGTTTEVPVDEVLRSHVEITNLDGRTYLAIEGVAIKLRLSVRKVLKLMKSGALAVAPGSNPPLIPTEAFTTYIEQHPTRKDRAIPPPPPRRDVSVRTRYLIFQRDGFRCQLCGGTAPEGATLVVDHRHPVSKGGTNDVDNLWTLCWVCNAGKSDLPVEAASDGPAAL